jgi:subtilase family serine protease
MKFNSFVFRSSLLLLAIVSFMLVAPRAAAQTQAQSQSSLAQAPVVPARITQAIDETQLVRLKGNVHPLARPEFDRGVVAASMPLQRMLLVLKRSADQETALAQFLLDQQNANSPNYHKWLTPEQFGAQFGPADTDIQAVTSWLQVHGFQVAKISKGKLAIEFSGTAAQVKQAFHTEIHKLFVNGEQHLANTADPQIPAALLPVVHGLAPLNNFRPKPMHHVVGEFRKLTPTSEVMAVKPEFTTSGGLFELGPTDFATIYNVLPLWNATPTPIDGTGQSIAVVGVSNINLQDVADFRTLFGLPTGGTNTPVVVIDGTDPGIVNDGSETEALLDTEWSGAVAKGAQIHLVIAADTDIASGLILAIFHVIDYNSDPILSVSFGNCEAGLGTNGNSLLKLLWEQSAAQGITVTVSTGDDGSAGCEDQNAPAPHTATTGLQVSGFASTQFNVAVGGTDFNDASTQNIYFSGGNDPNTLVSALSYIPESTWNESCTNAVFGGNPEANCNSTLSANKAAVITVGGSGGRSAVYAEPAYQQFSGLTGMPADGSRHLPDVSLFASTGFAGTPPNTTPLSKSSYVVCEADFVSSPSCDKSAGTFHFLGVGGTSASTPAFAGIMALVNQKTGQRQGNANFVLYKLAQQQFLAGTVCASVASPLPNAACTFNDVTTGTIAMPCTKGSLDCTTTVGTDTIGVLSGFNATAGYDLATGLGSVNASNLVNNWNAGAAAFTGTSTTLALNPTTLTAGANVTVNITVTRSGGTATPSGDVALVSTAANGQGVDGFTLDGTGKVVNGTTNQLTGGSYQVTARYGGDGTFAPSVSAPVNVTVNKAGSNTVASVLVASGTNFVPFTSGPAPVTLFLQATVNPTGSLLPTGTVTFVDNGTPVAGATNVGVNVAGEAFTANGISTFGAGSHSIVAQYSGDPSFNASNSAAVAFTITTAGLATTTAVTSSSTSISSGGSVTLTATVTGTGSGASPTGTVQFKNGTANLGAAAACTAVAGAAVPTCKATLTTTLAFLAPLSGPNQVPTLRFLPLGFVAYASLLLLLLGLKRVPAPYRRACACAAFLLLVSLMAGLAGCGGSGGGGGGGHTDSITAVYSGDATYAGSTSPAISITIR